MNPGVYLYFAFAGAVASLLLVPLFKYLSIRSGVMDVPRPGRIHTRATPLLGGPAIFLGLLVVIGGHFALGQLLANTDLLEGWLSPNAMRHMRRAEGAMPRLTAILIGAAVIMAVGVADDARSLPIWLRLGTEIAAAAVVVGMGVKPELYILPRWLVYIVAVLWIVGITNSFNLIDSMDGLAAGVAAISAVLLGLWAALSHQPMVAIMLAVFAGVMIGFLFFNSSPASIFLGSSGSMLIGYFLAVTVLVSTFMIGKGSGLLPVVMPLIILGVPLYDTASVVAIRLYRRRSPFTPDLNHLAHRIHRLGLTRKQTVLFVYLVTFAVGMSAVVLSDVGKLHVSLRSWAVLVQVLAIFGIIVILEWVSFGSRYVTLTTPIPAGLEIGGDRGFKVNGILCRLGMTRAELEVEDVDRLAVAAAVASGSDGRLDIQFEAPFEAMEVEATFVALARTEDDRWRIALRYDGLTASNKKNLEFALTHYRALGEG
jgi:UDP-GlcNAc:undecaprenyl-phosphate/decaprenyl-phosphate GlcNAc-1-phosphate transferase